MTRIQTGIATIAAGDTSVTVTHGVPETPTLDKITVTPLDDINPWTAWPSDPTALTFKINISSMCMTDYDFSWTIVYETTEPTGYGVAVTCDKVRARIHVDSSEVSDTFVADFIDDATAEIQEIAGVTIDHMAPTGLESAAITNLAALYCYAHLKSGGPANITYTMPGVMAFQSLDPTIQLLKDRLNKAIARLQDIANGECFKVAESNQTTDDQLWE